MNAGANRQCGSCRFSIHQVLKSIRFRDDQPRREAGRCRITLASILSYSLPTLGPFWKSPTEKLLGYLPESRRLVNKEFVSGVGNQNKSGVRNNGDPFA